MFVISVYISYCIQSCKLTVIVLWPDCHKSYWTQWCWKHQEKPEIGCSTIWCGGSGRRQRCLYILRSLPSLDRSELLTSRQDAPPCLLPGNLGHDMTDMTELYHIDQREHELPLKSIYIYIYIHTVYLLGQWLNCKLFGITYLEGKIRFKLILQGPLAKWVYIFGMLDVPFQCPFQKEYVSFRMAPAWHIYISKLHAYINTSQFHHHSGLSRCKGFSGLQLCICISFVSHTTWRNCLESKVLKLPAHGQHVHGDHVFVCV